MTPAAPEVTAVPEVIVTPRLVLRKARVSDLPGLHDIMRRPEAMRYWSRPEHDSIDDTARFLTAMIDASRGESDDFIVTLEGRVIGKAGAWRLPEVGFLLHPDHWGQGLAREAMAAVIAHLFRWHPIPAITAEADPRNAASLGLLARLGFRETHRAVRTLKWRDEWCDSVYLALPRPAPDGATDP